MSRPLIAILRGIRPEESISISRVLIEAGITRIEVPLNSPDPFSSIENIIQSFGDQAEIGAGTVLSVTEVERLAEIGGKMVVSPNCNTDVIRATKKAGLKSYPGVLTPTECFTALDSKADGLKFFPSFLLGPTGLAAIKSVLPIGSELFAVGGVGPDNFETWLQAGATGFGIGSSLYRPGYSESKVAEIAKSIVEAFDSCAVE